MSDTAMPEKGLRGRKAKAILAAGLVLGVGTVATLAAWNDSEYAAGTFTAGSFNLQSSTTSATADFADHASAGGAAPLLFSAGFDQMAPEEQTYSSLWVRLAPGTTMPATVSLADLTFTDVMGTNSTQLSWSAAMIPATATCDASAASTGTLLGAGATLAENVVPATSFTLQPGASAAFAGAPLQICLQVAGNAGLEQGGQTTATWHFAGASV